MKTLYLWKEEQQVLYELASKVPKNGTILEIGTGSGSSALIFHKATKGKNVQIFSLDVFDSLEAKELLKNTSVHLINLASFNFIHLWQEKNQLIDLLFIDGSHIFKDIFNDYNLWVKYLVPKKGKIAFHDYDPRENGGVSHFAVKIFLDTLLRKKVIIQPWHVGRILYGCVKKPLSAEIKLKDYRKTFKDFCDRIDSVSNQKRIGKNRLINCYQLGNNLIQNKKMNFGKLQREFLKLEEMHSMLKHIRTHSIQNNLNDFSKLLALEQVNLFILNSMLKLLEK